VRNECPVVDCSRWPDQPYTKSNNARRANSTGSLTRLIIPPRFWAECHKHQLPLSKIRVLFYCTACLVFFTFIECLPCHYCSIIYCAFFLCILVYFCQYECSDWVLKLPLKLIQPAYCVGASTGTLNSTRTIAILTHIVCAHSVDWYTAKTSGTRSGSTSSAWRTGDRRTRQTPPPQQRRPLFPTTGITDSTAWLSVSHVGLWPADFPCFAPDLLLTGDHFVGKLSAMDHPTRLTQPSNSLGSVNE